MPDSAASLFNALNSYAQLRSLIADGQAEGQFLECKAPSSPNLDRGLRAQLSQAVSGFANSGGGVIIWGMSTDSHVHSGLDVLTQIQPIGQCRRLSQRIDTTIPTLTVPAVACPPSKVISAKLRDTKGVVVTLIPGSSGDPVQTLDERRFWMRVGASFVEMPYEVLKRMFASVDSPDLTPVFDSRLVKREPDGKWTVPFLIANNSVKAADGADFLITVLNPAVCQSIIPHSLKDLSRVNPDKLVFGAEVTKPIYRGLRIVVGSLQVEMKKLKRARRVLNFEIKAFASGMRARKWTMRVELAKKGFSVRQLTDEFIS